MVPPSASCLRMMPPGLGTPTTKRKHSSSSDDSPTPLLTHTGPLEPGWAHCARRCTPLHLCWSGTASGYHLNPLRKSEGERKHLAGLWAFEHIYLNDRGFSLHTDEKTLSKSWPQATDMVVIDKISNTVQISSSSNIGGNSQVKNML